MARSSLVALLTLMCWFSLSLALDMNEILEDAAAMSAESVGGGVAAKAANLGAQSSIALPETGTGAPSEGEGKTGDATASSSANEAATVAPESIEDGTKVQGDVNRQAAAVDPPPAATDLTPAPSSPLPKTSAEGEVEKPSGVVTTPSPENRPMQDPTPLPKPSPLPVSPPHKATNMRPCAKHTKRWMCILEDIMTVKKTIPKDAVVPVPGVQFIGQGFDSITGDTRAPVLLFFNEESPQSWTKVPSLSIISGYDYPVGVFCDPVAKFKDESTDQTITNSEQAEKHSSGKFGLSFLGGMMSCSSSSDKTRSSLQENFINEVSKTLDLFKIRLSDGRVPPLHPDFLKELSELPAKYERSKYKMAMAEEFRMIHHSNPRVKAEPYRRFIRRFGTHYTAEVKMGGSLTLKIETERKSAEQVDSSAMKMQAEADLSALINAAGNAAGVAVPAALGPPEGGKKEKDHMGMEKSEFNAVKNAESHSTKKVKIEGGDPPLVVDSLSPDEMYRWYQSIAENPSVMSSKSVPIIDVVAEADIANADAVYENFVMAYDDWYSDAGILASLKDIQANRQFKLDSLRVQLEDATEKKKKLEEEAKEKEEEVESDGFLKRMAKRAGRAISRKLGNREVDEVAQAERLEKNLKDEILVSCNNLCEIKAEVNYFMFKLYGDDFGREKACKLACGSAANSEPSAMLGLKVDVGKVSQAVKNFMTSLHVKRARPLPRPHDYPLSDDIFKNLVLDLSDLTQEEKLLFKADFVKMTTHTVHDATENACQGMESLSVRAHAQFCPALFSLLLDSKPITPDCSPTNDDLTEWEQIVREGGDMELVKLVVDLNPRGVVELDKRFEPGGLKNYLSIHEGSEDGGARRHYDNHWDDSEKENMVMVLRELIRAKINAVEVNPVENREPSSCSQIRATKRELASGSMPDVYTMKAKFYSIRLHRTKDETKELTDEALDMDHQDHEKQDIGGVKMVSWVSPEESEADAHDIGPFAPSDDGRKISLDDKEVSITFPMKKGEDPIFHFKVVPSNGDWLGTDGAEEKSLGSFEKHLSTLQQSGAKKTEHVSLAITEVAKHIYGIKSEPVLSIDVSVKKLSKKKAKAFLEGDKPDDLELLEEYHHGAEFLFGIDHNPLDMPSYEKYNGARMPDHVVTPKGAWRGRVTQEYAEPLALLQEGEGVAPRSVRAQTPSMTGVRKHREVLNPVSKPSRQVVQAAKAYKHEHGKVERADLDVDDDVASIGSDDSQGGAIKPLFSRSLVNAVKNLLGQPAPNET